MPKESPRTRKISMILPFYTPLTPTAAMLQQSCIRVKRMAYWTRPHEVNSAPRTTHLNTRRSHHITA